MIYVAWILFLWDSSYIDHWCSTGLTIQPHPLLPSPTPSGSNAGALGVHVTHTWHAGLCMTRARLQVHGCICVALYTFVPTHMCLLPDLTHVFSVWAPGRVPYVKSCTSPCPWGVDMGTGPWVWSLRLVVHPQERLQQTLFPWQVDENVM